MLGAVGTCCASSNYPRTGSAPRAPEGHIAGGQLPTSRPGEANQLFKHGRVVGADDHKAGVVPTRLKENLRRTSARRTHTGALVQGFAAGALLAMLADTMLPEAYKVEGVLTGPLVVVGFAISLALSAIE